MNPLKRPLPLGNRLVIELDNGLEICVLMISWAMDWKRSEMADFMSLKFTMILVRELLSWSAICLFWARASLWS